MIAARAWVLLPFLAAWAMSDALRIGAAEPVSATDPTSVIVVVGAAGEKPFGEAFARQAGQWEAACDRGGARHWTVGGGETNVESDHDRLHAALTGESKDTAAELWIILIGHGSFDGKAARFALKGPDLTGDELAGWLEPFSRPIAVINTASCSAPFINALSATNRVVITATRSGFEQNYTRFGQFLAEAITDPASDLDHDGQVSLLEAFLTASRKTADFYKSDNRLATEHALLDDNGDKLGTPADWFRGVRATQRTENGAAVDGSRAAQFHLVRSPEEASLSPAARARRDALELEVAKLRDAKAALAEAEYRRQLEVLLLELARLYETNSVPPARTP